MVALTNIGSSKIYFAIGQSHSDLKTKLDNAMRRITDDNPYYADELHKQFLSVDSVYFLTGEEPKMAVRAWSNQNRLFDKRWRGQYS